MDIEGVRKESKWSVVVNHVVTLEFTIVSGLSRASIYFYYIVFLVHLRIIQDEINFIIIHDVIVILRMP